MRYVCVECFFFVRCHFESVMDFGRLSSSADVYMLMMLVGYFIFFCYGRADPLRHPDPTLA